MAQFSHPPVFWSLTCSPAHMLAQGPAVNGQHPLALSLRTNSTGESLPGSPQSPLTQLGDPSSWFLVVGGCPALWKSTTNALCHSPSLRCPAVLLLLNWTCKYPQKVNVFKC